MKHEFIKMLEKCTAEKCSFCKSCLEAVAREKEELEGKHSDSLYKKEVEQYYFYFLESKAS